MAQEKYMLEKREYTHALIFEKYLNDECPVCDFVVWNDSEISHTEFGGKCMAKNYRCKNCNSEYIVGFNRPSYPINSEISYNAVHI